MRTASVFRSEWKCGDFRQARHRDLSKPWAEAIEPASDADGCDRKIVGRGVVNSFDRGVPGGDARRRERPFTPQPPGDKRGQMKADHLVFREILIERSQHMPPARKFDERTVIGRHAWRRDDIQLRANGGEDVGLEHALDDHNLGVTREIGETEPEMKRAA